MQYLLTMHFDAIYNAKSCLAQHNYTTWFLIMCVWSRGSWQEHFIYWFKQRQTQDMCVAMYRAYMLNTLWHGLYQIARQNQILYHNLYCWTSSQLFFRLFFIHHSTRLFQKIRNNLKSIKTKAKTLENIYLQYTVNHASITLHAQIDQSQSFLKAPIRLCWGVMRPCDWLYLSVDSTDNPWLHQGFSFRVVEGWY